MERFILILQTGFKKLFWLKYQTIYGKNHHEPAGKYDFDILDVSSISPNVGSKMGGQTITINGRFFTDTVSNVDVTVGGINLVFLSASGVPWSKERLKFDLFEVFKGCWSSVILRVGLFLSCDPILKYSNLVGKQYSTSKQTFLNYLLQNQRRSFNEFYFDIKKKLFLFSKAKFDSFPQRFMSSI